jgi:hypothetical protein
VEASQRRMGRSWEDAWAQRGLSASLL